MEGVQRRAVDVLAELDHPSVGGVAGAFHRQQRRPLLLAQVLGLLRARPAGADHLAGGRDLYFAGGQAAVEAVLAEFLPCGRDVQGDEVGQQC